MAEGCAGRSSRTPLRQAYLGIVQGHVICKVRLHYGVEKGQVAQVFFCERNRYNTTRVNSLENSVMKFLSGGGLIFLKKNIFLLDICAHRPLPLAS